MLDAALAPPHIAAEALAGLTARPKTLPPKLFYDAEGVRLFGQITELPEYYLTRTERALLGARAADIAALAPAGATLVEYGASDAEKALMLLQAPGSHFGAYVPIDVAAEALAAIGTHLTARHATIPVHPLCADFLGALTLPPSVPPPYFGFFPGSTIGNLEPEEAQAFLTRAAATLGPDAWLIVGTDLRKSPQVLLPAYNDAQGITAAFNRNILTRLNREAGADFQVARFAHRAIWNDGQSRIEMHLVSLGAQTVHLAGHTIRFTDGETIHTENSYKHSVESFQSIARAAGWSPARLWTDDEGKFSLHGLRG